MKINVISHKNGSGLELDYAILKEATGLNMNFVEWTDEPTRADLNIFLELFDPKHLNSAPVNYMIPNQEWFEPTWNEYIPKFDLIICKTKYAAKQFKARGGKTAYTSFTSYDRYLPSIGKEKKLCHLPGKSKTKGTSAIANNWKVNKMPPVFILSQKMNINFNIPNVRYMLKKLPVDQFRIVQNTYQLHLCPSKSEGFGHYINEAMSCKGVVITTDAPPMNELVTEERGFLIKPMQSKPNRMGDDYFIGNTALTLTVYNAMQCENLEEKGEAARRFFLDNDKFFRSEIKKVFK